MSSSSNNRFPITQFFRSRPHHEAAEHHEQSVDWISAGPCTDCIDRSTGRRSLLRSGQLQARVRKTDHGRFCRCS